MFPIATHEDIILIKRNRNDAWVFAMLTGLGLAVNGKMRKRLRQPGC